MPLPPLLEGWIIVERWGIAVGRSAEQRLQHLAEPGPEAREYRLYIRMAGIDKILTTQNSELKTRLNLNSESSFSELRFKRLAQAVNFRGV